MAQNKIHKYQPETLTTYLMHFVKYVCKCCLNGHVGKDLAH